MIEGNKARKPRQKTKSAKNISRKSGRKLREGRKEGAKEGRIPDIKVSIVA